MRSRTRSRAWRTTLRYDAALRVLCFASTDVWHFRVLVIAGRRCDIRERIETRGVHRRERHRRALRAKNDKEAIPRVLDDPDEVSIAIIENSISYYMCDTWCVSSGWVRRGIMLRLSHTDDGWDVWAE